jgi:nitrite reductase/ring-hydroxylating ferredoxin subunit
MRRAEGLVALSRRQFCGGMATCLGLTLAGCIDGDTGVIETGPLGSGGSQGSNGTSPDAGTSLPPPDGGAAASCPTTGVTDVGAPSTFVAGTPKYFSAGNFFVVRDAGGLYALTARCTHEGATCVVQSSQFYCPRHAAKFDFNGGVVSGPVFTALKHYALCLMSNGHVGVITSMVVAKTVRLVA